MAEATSTNNSNTSTFAAALGSGYSPEMVMAETIRESCAAKTALSGVMGFGLGAFFGLFMSSVDWNMNNEAFMTMTTKEQLKFTLKDMVSRSYSSGKNFALVGAVYSSSECVIESFRAKNDIYNAVAAGCFSGGVLAARAGPQAAAFGCASFAAFSAAIETWIRSSD